MKKLLAFSLVGLIAFGCSLDDQEEPQPVICPIRPTSSEFVTTLFDYTPAPGQFINVSPGNKESAESILGKKGMVTLGAFGGTIVLGFDHTVINQTGDDFMVYGNAMATSAEPGIVWVMHDANGNRLPDDVWYELAGSEFGKSEYKRGYSVTYFRPLTMDQDVKWIDSEGKEGVVKKNTYHKQAYYPEWILTDSYTLTGSCLAGKIDLTTPTFIKSNPYEWGYADNTVGGDKMDISNAKDANGNSVSLIGIDFVKIQTAVMADLGWTGELSTEVIGVEDLGMQK